MADFAAVLRKTIAALGENTPEARERIYQKARSTIEAKMIAVTPPPSAQVIERQMRVLEDAIASVKAEYVSAPAAPEPENDFDKVLKDLEALSKAPSSASPKAAPIAVRPAMEKVPAAPIISAPEVEEKPVTLPEPQDEASAEEPFAEDIWDENVPAEDAAKDSDNDEELDVNLDEPDTILDEDEDEDDSDEPWPEDSEPVELVAPVIKAPEMPKATPSVATTPSHAPIPQASKRPAPEPDKREQNAVEVDAGSEISDPVQDETFDDRPALRELRNRRAVGKKSRKLPIIAAAILLLLGAGAVGAWIYRDDVTQLAGFSTDTTSPEEAGPSGASAGIETAGQPGADDSTTAEPLRKLTQRLLPDGSEVDGGPASGQSTVGEGTSIAAATEGPDRAEGEAAPQNNDAAVTVGQKAIFYEERTVQEQASASNGTVVWTVEQESPGADLPPEPVIHAEATIPDKRLRLKMSLRRNVDQSLPASYIAELIFITPDDFAGGSVGSVASVSLKQTEQDAGNRLLGVPAKIADGFFLVALSDNKSDIESNNMLLERMDWIDIPIVYASGRRALITLEKGSVGVQVFNQALAAWKAATSG